MVLLKRRRSLGVDVSGAAPDTAATGRVVFPDGIHDLRADREPRRLVYAPNDVLVVSGLPGSGKTTLMRRCVRVLVVDSQDIRTRRKERFPRWVPYAVYRPLVRLEHYRRLRRAMLGGSALAVHDCGTVPFVRRWLRRTARRQGRGMHLLLLDASTVGARDGQLARGRRVSRYAMFRHRVTHRRELDRLGAAEGATGDWQSVVVLDRIGALLVTGIGFTDDAGPLPAPTGRRPGIPAMTRTADREPPRDKRPFRTAGRSSASRQPGAAERRRYGGPAAGA
jgi:hypothetical protein